MVVELRLGDVIRLRKAHPCGGSDWEVTRLGADIGMRCLECHHRVLLGRSVVEHRIKTFVTRGPVPPDGASAGSRPGTTASP